MADTAALALIVGAAAVATLALAVILIALIWLLLAIGRAIGAHA